MPRALFVQIDVGMPTHPKLFDQPVMVRHLWTCLLCRAKEHHPADGIIRGLSAKALASLYNLGNPRAVEAALAYFASVGMVRVHPDGAIEILSWSDRGNQHDPEALREKWRKDKQRQRGGGHDGQLSTMSTEDIARTEVDKSTIVRSVEEEEEEEKRKRDQKKIIRPPAVLALALTESPAAPASPFAAYVAAEWPDLKNPAAFEARAREAFPAVDLLAEAKKARAWELSAPTRKRKNHGPYLYSWLGKAQENIARQSQYRTTAQQPLAPGHTNTTPAGRPYMAGVADPKTAKSPDPRWTHAQLREWERRQFAEGGAR